MRKEINIKELGFNIKEFITNTDLNSCEAQAGEVTAGTISPATDLFLPRTSAQIARAAEETSVKMRLYKHTSLSYPSISMCARVEFAVERK